MDQQPSDPVFHRIGICFSIVGVYADGPVYGRVGLHDFNDLREVSLFRPDREHVRHALFEGEGDDAVPILIEFFYLQMAVRINEHGSLYHIDGLRIHRRSTSEPGQPQAGSVGGGDPISACGCPFV